MSLVIGIVGCLIGLACFIYAVYENRSKKKLSNYIRLQNWHLYGKANNASGHVQTALAKYKSTPQETINLEALEFLSKADAFTQEVFKDVIKQIQVSEPDFDPQTIQRWIDEGRIAQEHSPHFLALTPANKTIQSTKKIGATDG